MTYLTGEIRIYRSSRLFDRLSPLLVNIACVATAMNAHTGRVVAYNIGDYADFESNLFPVEVRLPLVGPIELAVAGQQPNSLVVAIAPQTPRALTLSAISIQDILSNTIAPVLTAFIEDHYGWLIQNVSTDVHQWPSVLNFGRVVRNAASHSGRVNIRNKNTPPVSWYSITYGPDQDGRKIIGTDLPFADLLILMMEMSDELDRLNCPTFP